VTTRSILSPLDWSHERIRVTLRRVGVASDGKAGASIRLSRDHHFQMINLSFFFSELISEVTVLLVLIHQLLYGLKNYKMLNTPDEVEYTNTYSDGRANS
jgi:hypothetical protein